MAQLIINALTTLEKVKEELEIDVLDITQDNLLIDKINAFSEVVQNLLGRTFRKKQYKIRTSGTKQQHLTIPIMQIETLLEVKIDNQIIDLSEVEITGKQKDRLFRINGWIKSMSLNGMSHFPVNALINVEINLIAGYILPKDSTLSEPRTLPYDIEKVIIDFISIDMAQKGSSKGLASFKISDVNWQFIGESGMKNNLFANASKVLNIYRTFRM